ncbi:molybdenum cofactor biosynthesis protein MoaE [Cellulomonas soli]|uniref:Molybdenum cofactor biosynthesis protein MoaE n=1 Tax=Cellulomonas soli TaxID=931535 RepID=A0A512PCT6_9CELL|nr:molybdenum cofactor biosynthesis protein MoaE [Cellulomonas soli]NYI58583.1 molybdopterin synthase catalytic subunit [Cellulomonas soli]GEP69008.1 molybdenum cofactor biosynthesis protein MoaE [Cellulomonas soli]
MSVLAQVTHTPLDLGFHVEQVSGPQVGALATFLGVVRDHDPSVPGEVVALDYSAHPDAGAELERIAHEIADRDGVLGVAVSHRIGHLAVGEAALVAVVASAHRAEAFDACRELVERVKAQLPVWKREVLADGSHLWVGL